MVSVSVEAPAHVTKARQQGTSQKAPLTNAQRQARWRRNHQAQIVKPFIGVDGEGAGVDPIGRQHYLLLCAGRRSLFRANRPLTTMECLEFICDLPANAYLVGFFFSYDVTMILRDVPYDKINQLFWTKEQRTAAGWGSNYVFWNGYGIEFRPSQYFRVAHIDPENFRVVPGSARTINEVGGFFQKSFVEVLRDRNIGTPEQIEFIARQKDRREKFTEITQIERDYCTLECRLLAQVMESFRKDCVTHNIVPRDWRGAGAMAARLHEMFGTPNRKQLKRSKALDAYSISGFYGGRFEITTIGRIAGPIYEYDIRSAYPSAMLKLPCPRHTKWRKFNGPPPPQYLLTHFIAKLHFRHADTNLCGFPIRENGKLYWPKEGNGIYWSPEILAAPDETKISYRGGYGAEYCCDCRSFEWVQELYNIRQQLASNASGYPIKLGINALYGKLAQQRGSAPFRDHIAAGLITAYCRAQLMQAVNQAPDKILMVATDAIFSRVPLDLPIGPGLGQWEAKIRPDIFIVQPGIYWSSGSDNTPKTRGIPRSRVIEERARFEYVWDHWHTFSKDGDTPPVIPVEVPGFIGHRMALHRGKPQLAGHWTEGEEATRRISFDWQGKRQPIGAAQRGFMKTRPMRGSADLESQAYDHRLITDLLEAIMDDEAQPDYIYRGNSGE